MFTNLNALRATVEITGAKLLPLNPAKCPEASAYFEDGKVLPTDHWDALRELVKTAHNAASGMFHFADQSRDGWDVEQYKALTQIVDDALTPLLESLDEAADLLDAADHDTGVYTADVRSFQ